MSFQAYLDNIQAKTGKTPDDFARLVKDRGFTKHGEIVAWLKSDFALGHGHANALVAVLLKKDLREATFDQKVDALFDGRKSVWRKAYGRLVAQVRRFGPDVAVVPNETYLNLLRGTKKFGILQPSTVDRFDVGLKLKGVAPEGRFEAAGSWNAMVTHRVKLADAKEVDAELVAWLRRAYDAA